MARRQLRTIRTRWHDDGEVRTISKEEFFFGVFALRFIVLFKVCKVLRTCRWFGSLLYSMREDSVQQQSSVRTGRHVRNGDA